MTLRTVLLFTIIWVAIIGCADKLVCPAYQSAFIHDKDALRKKFSYFENDSTPKVFFVAQKTKYLIAEPESYKKRYRRMQTVALAPVKTVVPDSLLEGATKKPATDSLATDSLKLNTNPIDSLTRAKADSAKVAGTDSTYMISRDREVRILKYNFPDSLHYDSINNRYIKEIPHYYVDEVGYNTEQINYMWYFRKQLVLPDVRLAKMADKQSKQTQADKKKKRGFFRKLMFWKKDKKKATDSTAIKPAALNPSDSIFYNDSTDVKPAAKTSPTTAPKKKGILGIFKGKEKTGATTPTPAVTPATSPTTPKKKGIMGIFKRKEKAATPPPSGQTPINNNGGSNPP